MEFDGVGDAFSGGQKKLAAYKKSWNTYYSSSYYKRQVWLGAVVGLDDLDLERQALDDVVEELDGGGLVQRWVDAQHAQAGAVVDGGELEVLVAAAAAALWHGGERLDELHVDLHPVAGQLLLVPLPSAVVALVALGGRQAAHVQAVEDAPDAGLADGDVVVPLEVHSDLLRAEVVVLPQIDDLPDHLDVRRVRRLRGLGASAQALDTLGLVAAVPGVVRLPADPEVPAGHSDVPGDLFDMAYDGEAPLGLTVKRGVTLGFGMWISVVIGDPGVNGDRQF